MEPIDEFRDHFLEDLEAGGRALEDEGFVVENYQAILLTESYGIGYVGTGDTARQAWNQLIEELPEDTGRIPFPVESRLLSSVLQGQDDPMSFLGQGLQGGIEIEEPRVDTEWSDEKELAYGRIIRYVPEQPDGYYQIGRIDGMPHTGTKEEREHAYEIMDGLEKSGFKTEWTDF